MSGSGHGPFGEKAFRAALVGCGGLLIVGLLMVLVGGSAVRSVGTSFLVLSVLGLVTGGGGLLVESRIQRRRRRRQAPPPHIYRQNGQGARPSRQSPDFRDRL